MKFLTLLLVFFTSLQAAGPDYFIVGAQKAGTTALFNLLQQHPKVAKQVGGIHFFDVQFNKGQEWYEKKFAPFHANGKIAGDKSPYYLFHPLVAERVSSFYPEAKIFIVLRNPVDRTYSQYWFNIRNNREVLSFEEALEAEESRIGGQKERFYSDPLFASFKYMHYSYIARSRYVEQLKEWLKYFPPEQIMIVDADDLRHDAVATLRRAFKFLNLGDFAVSDKNASRHSDYPKMSEKTRKKLADYFKPLNKELEELLGQKFNWK